MPASQLDTDILIVGAGPVGLFLANECARRGIACRLIEAQPAQSAFSKALAIFPRTLEIFDMAGVVAPFLEVANRVTSVAVIAHGRQLAHMPFAPEETPYQFIAMVPQNVTEQLLLQALRSRGGEVEYDTAFVAAEQDGAGVTVTMNRRGVESTLRATYVIGCDGAHSVVRKAMQLHLEGGEYADSFMLADIESNELLPADQLQLCPSERGPLAIFPMSATRRRIVAMIDKPEGEAPSLELVQRLLADRAPSGVEARALHWSSYFRIHHRLAPQLRKGRLFLAGDSAHIHSPFGGQGMNTGLHDAWNLAWKLDLVLRGRGNDALLDSYGAERLPVIRSVIETTHFLTTVMGTPNRLIQALRNAVIPMVSRLTPFQHAFVGRLSELEIAYRGSPIIEGPGERYIDDSMRGGQGIRGRFLLMVGPDVEASSWDEAQALGAECMEVLEVRRGAGKGVLLVRPDGYLAYAGRDGARAIGSVRGVLQRQTGRN